MKIQKMPRRTYSAFTCHAATMIFSDRPRRNDSRRLCTIDKSLFGGHVVTADDIAAWLRAVPRLDPTGPRAARYIAAYDVAGKIAAAKADGTFWNTISATPPPRGF